MKNNKVYYKKRGEFTKEDELLIPPPPPPPPVPNASKKQILKAEKAYSDWKKRSGNEMPPPPPINALEHIENMTKKGAKFYFEGKEIDSDGAADLFKKDKKLSIESKSKNNSNYEVWISEKGIDATKKEENIKYYLDHKLISKKEMELIPTEKIVSVDVKKEKDGSSSIYITSKKQ